MNPYFLVLVLSSALWAALPAQAKVSSTCMNHPDLCQGSKTYVCTGLGAQIITKITPLEQDAEYFRFTSDSVMIQNGRRTHFSRSSTVSHPSYVANVLGTSYLKYDYNDYTYWITSEYELHVKKTAFGQRVKLQLGAPYLNRVMSCREVKS